MVEWMGMELHLWALVAIALVFVLVATRKPPQSAISLESGTGKTGRTAQPTTPLSAEAVDVAKRLEVTVGKRKVPVTVLVNNVVFRSDGGGNWSAIDEALRVVALLNEVATVFLIACVSDDAQEQRVRDLALSTGLITPSGDTSTTGIPEHRLLMCSMHVGQIALVRQLRVSVHIGGSIALMEALCRFVPALVRIDPDAVASSRDDGARSTGGGVDSSDTKGVDCLGWKEYKSLAAAAGLSCAAPKIDQRKDASAVKQSEDRLSTTSGVGGGVPASTAGVEAVAVDS